METQQTQGKKRPIGWLIDKAMPVINDDAKLYFITCMFKGMSPNELYHKAHEIGKSKKIAQSARFLAIIYRDYGPAVFQQVIDLVKTVNVSQTEDTSHEKD